MADGKTRGIVFDMDNTLLHSHIDFKAMKTDVFAYLAGHCLINPDTDEKEHTTATLIELARVSGRLGEDMEQAVWQIVRNHEVEGMVGARLEPHVAYVLGRLSGKYVLTVLTNNAIDAALSALGANGVTGLFDCIAGREHVPALKPSPAGVLYILGKYPHIARRDWLCAGDSWIDGKAAHGAGISFISYRGDAAKLKEKGVHPLHAIQDMTDLLKLLP